MNRRIWTSLAVLSLAGQVWMVAASAVVVTVTSIVIGAISGRARTRWGRRLPFVVGGYLV